MNQVSDFQIRGQYKLFGLPKMFQILRGKISRFQSVYCRYRFIKRFVYDLSAFSSYRALLLNKSDVLTELAVSPRNIPQEGEKYRH